MGRSSLRHNREIYGMDSAGECAFQHGEQANDEWPYCDTGVRVADAEVLDETTLQITFSECVSVPSMVGVDYRINQGTWAQCLSVAKISDTVWDFNVQGGTTIMAGDDVDWRYQGGSDSILDCEAPPVDAGPLGPVNVQNTLVLAGGLFLLEEGGASIVLVEDDDDASAGIEVEDQI